MGRVEQKKDSGEWRAAEAAASLASQSTRCGEVLRTGLPTGAEINPPFEGS